MNEEEYAYYRAKEDARLAGCGLLLALAVVAISFAVHYLLAQ